MVMFGPVALSLGRQAFVFIWLGTLQLVNRRIQCAARDLLRGAGTYLNAITCLSSNATILTLDSTEKLSSWR